MNKRNRFKKRRKKKPPKKIIFLQKIKGLIKTRKIKDLRQLPQRKILTVVLLQSISLVRYQTKLSLSRCPPFHLINMQLQSSYAWQLQRDTDNHLLLIILDKIRSQFTSQVSRINRVRTIKDELLKFPFLEGINLDYSLLFKFGKNFAEYYY